MKTSEPIWYAWIDHETGKELERQCEADQWDYEDREQIMNWLHSGDEALELEALAWRAEDLAIDNPDIQRHVITQDPDDGWMIVRAGSAEASKFEPDGGDDATDLQLIRSLPIELDGLFCILRDQCAPQGRA